jgi:hypothetical protein
MKRRAARAHGQARGARLGARPANACDVAHDSVVPAVEFDPLGGSASAMVLRHRDEAVQPPADLHQARPVPPGAGPCPDAPIAGIATWGRDAAASREQSPVAGPRALAGERLRVPRYACPSRSAPPLSSRGLGRRPLTAETRVRIPVAVLKIHAMGGLGVNHRRCRHGAGMQAHVCTEALEQPAEVNERLARSLRRKRKFAWLD